MGLDNIPNVYPCRDLAIKDEHGSIDCKATQECGNCTWKNEFENDPITKGLVPVYGMIGTNCWYRGKFGNSMIDNMNRYNSNFENDMTYDFYGDDYEDSSSQGGISEEACIEMSNVMFQYAEAWSFAVNEMVKNKELPEQDKDRYIKDWIYAAWWLKFVGEKADGSAIWY